MREEMGVWGLDQASAPKGAEKRRAKEKHNKVEKKGRMRENEDVIWSHCG